MKTIKVEVEREGQMTDAHQRFVSQVARYDPEGVIAVEKQLEKQDVETAQIDDASIRQLQRAEDLARLEFARRVFRKGKRKPEGTFNGDTGKTEPDRREDVEWTSPDEKWPGAIARARLPAFYCSWGHVYRLCMRACDGKDVPEDIKRAFERDYPAIHERFMKGAVEARFKAENEAHEQAQRESKAKAKKAAAASREGRLEKRKEQRDNLQRLLKKLMSREAALRTRLRKVEASIRMLEKK